MRSQKGFSLIELLSVLVVMALIIILVAIGVLGEVDKARGSTVIAEARMVYIAAKAVVLESQENERISDKDFMAGLTGVVNDASKPDQTKISKRMATLLAPDVVLSGDFDSSKLEDRMSQASFVVSDKIVVSLTYDVIMSGRHFTVTIAGGEVSVTKN